MPSTPVAVQLRHTKCKKNDTHLLFTSLRWGYHEVISKSNVNLYTNAAMMCIVQIIFYQNNSTHTSHANMSPWAIAVCTLSLANWIGDEIVYHNKCEEQRTMPCSAKTRPTHYRQMQFQIVCPIFFSHWTLLVFLIQCRTVYIDEPDSWHQVGEFYYCKRTSVVLRLGLSCKVCTWTLFL